jgi:hypothetical protein
MIRFWFLALLLVGLMVDVSEARGRNRSSRSSGRTWQTQNAVRYSRPVSYSTPSNDVVTQSGVSQAAVSQTGGQSSQSPIRQVSYQSAPGSSSVHDGSMQAWAEDEARMMAERGTCGHIRPAPVGHFVGVGCGMTCIGSGTLVAEAHYQGKMVRVWRR